jgi:hypothetical protein
MNCWIEVALIQKIGLAWQLIRVIPTSCLIWETLQKDGYVKSAALKKNAG